MSIAKKLTTVAENQQAVYDAGKKAEHDKFWDVMQQNGTRTDYAPTTGQFTARHFTFDNFYPKYDIRPVGNATYLFYAWEPKWGNVKGSLKQRLDECGVVLDTSQATNLSQMFNYSAFTEIPTIDCTSTTTSASLFANMWGNLQTIEKLIVNENVTYVTWFKNTTGLENVVFEGVIGNAIDFSTCTKLTHDSLMSIINALKDFTGTSTTMTLTIGTDNQEKLTDAEKAIATEKGWTLA